MFAVKKLMWICFGQLVFLQAVYSQCLPRDFNIGCGGLSIPAAAAFPPINGRNIANKPVDLILSTGCPSQSIGVSISADDLIIDGCLNIAGTLPFTGAIIVNGAVPNVGQADVLYGCGNGNVAIIRENDAAGYSANTLSPFNVVGGIPDVSRLRCN